MMAGMWFALGRGCFAGGLLISGSILVSQALYWLKFGFAPDVSISYALDYLQIPYPVVQGVGARKIIDEVFRWPLGLVIFGVGALVGWFFTVLGKQAQQEEMMRKNKARGL